MSSDLKFPQAIPDAGRKPMVTLRDATIYAITLPKSERDKARWKYAFHALM